MVNRKNITKHGTPGLIDNIKTNWSWPEIIIIQYDRTQYLKLTQGKLLKV